MKKIMPLTFLGLMFLTVFTACAQDDKSQRPSPPAKASATLSSGAVVTIDYSQPALKGRAIGKDVEPNDGQIWRMGANEATVFETSKDVMIEGQKLPAGKYALFGIGNGNEWTLIFNKVWQTLGAYDYYKNKGEDALKVKLKAVKASSSTDRLTYTITKDGKAALTWGTLVIPFSVK